MQGAEFAAAHAALVSSVRGRQRRIGIQRDKGVQAIADTNALKQRFHIGPRRKRTRIQCR